MRRWTGHSPEIPEKSGAPKIKAVSKDEKTVVYVYSLGAKADYEERFGQHSGSAGFLKVLENGGPIKSPSKDKLNTGKSECEKRQGICLNSDALPFVYSLLKGRTIGCKVGSNILAFP